MGYGKALKNILRTALAAASAGLLFFLPAKGAEAETVRIGYYPIEGFHAVNELGNVSGYVVDYLNKIAETTGWKYEYVEAEDCNEAVRMLKGGEVDMVASFQDIQEAYQEEISVSATRIGITYGVLAQPKENGGYEYEDFRQFQGISIALEEGSVYEEQFAEYAKYHGFEAEVSRFMSTEAMWKALENGKAEAVVCDVMQVTEDMQLLGKFNATSFYFLFRTHDTGLERSLNEALLRIEREFPSYQNELMEEYFPIYNVQILTKSEKEFVESARTLRIGCPTYLEPISYLDPETGELAGITRDIMDRIAENSGLDFEYVPVPEGSITYDFFRENKIDIVTCVEYHSLNAASPGINLTDPYLVSRKAMVAKRGMEFDNDAYLKAGIVTGSQTFKQVIHAYYPNFEAVQYDDNRTCMDALVKGDIDVILQNQYVIEPFLSSPRYEGLVIIPTEGITDKHTMSILPAQSGSGETDAFLADSRLLSILNKAIANISESEVSRIIIEQSNNSAYQYDLMDFMYRYRYALILSGLIIAAGIFVVAYTYRIRRKNIRLVYLSEYKLKNIANNINGGVVVLNPGSILEISYANEGFWEMVQCHGEDREKAEAKDFRRYVDPEDMEKLEKAAYAPYTEPAQVSMQLNILCGKNSRIPVRFNGTAVMDSEKKVSLYGVILDITEETEMLEQLQLEQAKYSMVMEKADEILYEIDAVTGRIHMSEAFKKQFGWKYLEELEIRDMENVLDKWRVLDEDKEKLQEMFEISMYMSEDASCVIRIMDKDGSYRWCEVSQYVMSDDKNRPLMYIGKIMDVDKDIREKEQLEAKTMTDPLTGLFNKTAFLHIAGEYLKEHPQGSMAVIFMDLDNFKSVNDLLGHMEGDKAIMDAAAKLQEIFGEQNVLSRFGGDEFCILVKETSMEELEELLKWTGEEMQEVYSDGVHNVPISASIGASCNTGDTEDISLLLANADKALYYVKENGKGNYYIYGRNAE